MYLPATPALAGLPPIPLAQERIPASGAAAPAATPARTVLRVGPAKLNVLAGRTATVAGALLSAPRLGAAPQAQGGQIVSLQARGRGGWRTVAGARTGAHGRYRLRYRANRIGSERLRVSFAGAAGELGAHRSAGRLNVYRLVEASWYGGGGSLACGGWLTSSTLGVANKTLPCGTPVTLRYGGRTVRVRVIDRGPYVEGREYDLTEATARALGFEGVGEVWATA
jgi:rare lipoprotein A